MDHRHILEPGHGREVNTRRTTGKLITYYPNLHVESQLAQIAWVVSTRGSCMQFVRSQVNTPYVSVWKSGVILRQRPFGVGYCYKVAVEMRASAQGVILSRFNENEQSSSNTVTVLNVLKDAI